MTTPQTSEWEARTREYERKWDRYRERRSAVFPITKAAIFDALNAAVVTRVALEFEGSADSGQMEQATAFSGEEEIVTFPKACIEITRVDVDEEKDTREEVTRTAGAGPTDLVRQFRGVRPAKLAPMLEALAALGQARKASGGRYAA